MKNLQLAILTLIFSCTARCLGNEIYAEQSSCCNSSENKEWLQIYQQKGTHAAESFLKKQLHTEGTIYGGSLRGRATSLNSLSCLYDWLGRYDDLANVYRQIREDEDVALVHGSDSGAVDAMGALAALRCRQGRYDDAENLIRSAMHWYYCVGEPALANDPFDKIFERAVWLSPFEDTSSSSLLLTLFETWRAKGKLAESEDLLKRALSRFASSDIATSPGSRRKHASFLRAQASLFEQQNHWAKASDSYKQAILVNDNDGPVTADVDNLGGDLINLARLQSRDKLHRMALETVDRALKFDESTFGKGNFRVARDLRAQSEILTKLHREKEALRACMRALSIDRHAFGPDHLMCARDLALAKDPKCKEIYLLNLERAKHFLGPNDPHAARISKEMSELR